MGLGKRGLGELLGFIPVTGRERPQAGTPFGPQGAGKHRGIRVQGVCLNRRKPETERRKWPRLPLAIPVVVRSRDDKEKEFLEFATALNISAGGALVAVRRALPRSAQLLLEIPSAPLAATTALPKASRALHARAVRVTHAEGYHLVGVKFAHPLLNHAAKSKPKRRKVGSSL